MVIWMAVVHRDNNMGAVRERGGGGGLTQSDNDNLKNGLLQYSLYTRKREENRERRGQKREGER